MQTFKPKKLLTSTVDYLSYQGSQSFKDALYMRRANWFPWNYYARQRNIYREQNDPAYHSYSRHGADNSPANIDQRHHKDPVTKKSLMVDPLTQAKDIPAYKDSSRFTSAGWEDHSYADAKNNFEQTWGITGVTWLSGKPAGSPPMNQIPKMPMYIYYSNRLTGDYDVGFVSTQQAGGGASDELTHTAFANINYIVQPDGSVQAWVAQLFPVPKTKVISNPGQATHSSAFQSRNFSRNTTDL